MGNVLVCGLGISGRAAVDYLRGDSRVESLTLVDAGTGAGLDEYCAGLAGAEGIRVFTGADHVPDGHYDLAIMSPGIAPHSELFLSAAAAATSCISELELAARIAPPGVVWVAVTGTNGKTTTTGLLTGILRAAGRVATSVGNIGTAAVSVAARAQAGEILVAEVSSYQLALTREFAPRVAALLNISPDHKKWHQSFAAYAAAKARLFAAMTKGDTAFIPGKLPGRVPARPLPDELEEALRAAGRRGVDIVAVGSDTVPVPAGTALPALKGKHNLSNALFACAMARKLGVGAAAIVAGLGSFRMPPHRLELVSCQHGVEYYNDSKATNSDATLQALAAFPGKAIHLLVGGQSKGESFEELARLSLPFVKAVYCFGEAGSALEQAYRSALASRAPSPVKLARFSALREAVEAARQAAGPGELVLLSPANASFDEFADYKQRGEAFVAAVQQTESDR
jgi:UDP-N-acetylmuramoylalanine--D-glutamate ligase